jgi:hypothetical protein
MNLEISKNTKTRFHNCTLGVGEPAIAPIVGK